MNNNFERGWKIFWANRSQELGLSMDDVQMILAIQPKKVLIKDSVDSAFDTFRDTQEGLWTDDLVAYYTSKLLHAPVEHNNPTLEKHIEITEIILKNRFTSILQSGLNLTEEQRDVFIDIQ